MRVVIAGGHGKIALRLTRLLSDRGDEVVSLIRNPDHVDDVRAAGAEPITYDLEQGNADELAGALASADAAVFAAGAGPGSGAERKWTMDRDGAIKLLEAARAASVPRFLIISSTGAESPPQDDDVFSVYLRAKAEADQAVAASDRRWSIVRPGGLTDEPGSGQVRVSAEAFRGRISRDDVAAVLAALLARDDADGHTIYVNGGEEPIDAALDRVLGAGAS
jgi:nucleoside-diphosphate-sugar epimerase